MTAYDKLVENRKEESKPTKEEILGYYTKREELRKEWVEYTKEEKERLTPKLNKVVKEFIDFYKGLDVKHYAIEQKDLDYIWTAKSFRFGGEDEKGEPVSILITIYRQDGVNHFETEIPIPEEAVYTEDFYSTDENLLKVLRAGVPLPEDLVKKAKATRE